MTIIADLLVLSLCVAPGCTAEATDAVLDPGGFGVIRETVQTQDIPLVLTRLTGSSGEALISNAIPLPPGLLLPDQVDRVQFFVGDREQAVYVEGLRGQHPDGSLRSILVQFPHTISRMVLPGKMRIGSARSLPDLQKTAVSYNLQAPMPEAVLLPTNFQYLNATRIVGPTVPLFAAQAFDNTWLLRWNTVGDAKWRIHETDFGTAPVGHIIVRNYYDRSLANFAHWVMSGNPEYFKRGILYAMTYRERYHRPNGYTVQPHETHIEGEALIYTLLGDEESRKAVQLHAEYMRDLWLPKLADPKWKYTANRPMARAIEAFLTAAKVDVPGDWETTLRAALDSFLEQQYPDGAYRYPAQCGVSNHFQTGLFNDALIRYWEEFERDPRIVPAIQRSVDWLWNTQWVASGGGFRYSEGPCTLPGAGATMDPAPDLNLLLVTAFGFLYQELNDPRYRQWGDIVFHEGIRRAWLGSSPRNGDKQFNQQFRSAFRYLHYRR